MNPETNRFENVGTVEELTEALKKPYESILPGQLVRPDGSPVPEHWSVFSAGEEIPIKGYVFRVAYIGETSILFEPVGPIVLNQDGKMGQLGQ